MPQNFDSVKFIIGDTEQIRIMECVRALQPFDEQVIDYLDRVSKLLMSNPESKGYPDVITFAFWCRKASIKNLQKPYLDTNDRIGRGVAFHIAPSNVAVNFAYSLVVGLLSGNANIVRVPSKDFDQVRLISDALFKALDDSIKPYICLLKYGHNQDITTYLSSVCDTRIIWGGDRTIATIRQSPLKARATDITFSDRYSIALIDADEYLKTKNKEQIAQGFFNDTYLNDQNACTSPKLIVWMGEAVRSAQETFWAEVDHIVKEHYILQPVQAVSKHASLCEQAITGESIHLTPGKDNDVIRVKVDVLTDHLMDHLGNSGYFVEYEADTLEEILPVCSSPCQTLSYYGIEIEKIRDFILAARPRGVDRIVPIGKTMDFTLVWDGYDLIRSLTRAVFAL